MKKLYTLALLSTFATLFSQTTFGVKGGYSLSNMTWKFPNVVNYKFDSKSSFYVGGLAEHRLSNKFSLQGELLFTQLGGKLKDIQLTTIVGGEVVEMGTITSKFTITQIQVPISAKYYFIPNFSLSGGFNFGLNISSKVKSDFVINGQNNGNVESFKTLNIFPFIGSEYKFTDNVFADIRYNFGTFNCAIENAPDTRIGILQVGLGYRFK